MLEQTATIANRRGLHARAAAKFVTLSERFSSAIEVVFDGQIVAAASIMGLMMLGAGVGSVIIVRADGPDAPEALAALVDLVESGFHESD